MAPPEVPVRSSKGYVCYKGKLGKETQWYVPKSSVQSAPKFHHSIESASDLHAILNTPTEEAWAPFCHPDFLMRLKGLDQNGNEGVLVFTSFQLEDHPNQKLILEPIPYDVAATVLNGFRDNLEGEKGKTLTDGQKVRRLSLDWKQSDCDAGGIDYEASGWEKSSLEDMLVHAVSQLTIDLQADKPADEQADDDMSGFEAPAAAASTPAASASTALVLQTAPVRADLEPSVSHSKGMYYVPVDAVKTRGSKSNVVSEKALAAVFSTKSPDKWIPYCNPLTLWELQGKEGTGIYTTFDIEPDPNTNKTNWPNEKRVLRLLSKEIASKALPYWKSRIEQEGTDSFGGGSIEQMDCLSVLDWKPENIPGKAQIHPQENKWEKHKTVFKTFKEYVTSKKNETFKSTNGKRPLSAAADAAGKNPKTGKNGSTSVEDNEPGWSGDVFTVNTAALPSNIEWIKHIDVGANYSIFENKPTNSVTIVKHCTGAAMHDEDAEE